MKLSIRLKIVSGLALVFLIGMIIGIYGLYSINKISVMSDGLTEIQEASYEISNVLTAHYNWRQNLTIAVMDNTEFTGSYDPDNCALGKWRNGETAKIIKDTETLALLAQIEEPHQMLHNEARIIMDKMESGQIEEAHEDY